MNLPISQLTVLPTFRERLFPLSAEEYALLKESIQREGIRDALVVWEQGGQYVVVDGHHRLQIAQELGINEVPVQSLPFQSASDALAFIDRNQLARRNLTPEQRALLIGRLYQELKKDPWRPEKGDQIGHLPEKTRHMIAEQVGVGEGTVQRAAAFADALEALQQVSPIAAQRVLQGEVKDALTRLPALRENQELLTEVAKQLETGVEKVATAVAQVRQEREKELLAPYLQTETAIERLLWLRGERERVETLLQQVKQQASALGVQVRERDA